MSEPIDRAEIAPDQYQYLHPSLVITSRNIAEACSRDRCLGGVSSRRDSSDCFAAAAEAKALLAALHDVLVDAASTTTYGDRRDLMKERFREELDRLFKDVPMPLEARIEL